MGNKVVGKIQLWRTRNHFRAFIPSDGIDVRLVAPTWEGLRSLAREWLDLDIVEEESAIPQDDGAIDFLPVDLPIYDHGA